VAQAEALRSALSRQPASADLHHRLGLSLRASGDLPGAIEAFRTALRFDPLSAITHGCLGNALKAAGQHEQAAASHTRAVELAPKVAEHWVNLALTYEAWGRAEAALASHAEALRLRPGPDMAASHAALLLRAGRFAEAEAIGRRAHGLHPSHPAAGLNLAAALRAQGRYAEAIAVLRVTVAANPDYADAHFNLGLCLLALGQWTEGWREREWRAELPGVNPPAYAGAARRWDGSPLGDRRLLLRAEQGLGDSLQFIRYAGVARAGAGGGRGQVAFLCPPALAPLMGGCRHLDAVIGGGGGEAAELSADVEAPLMSLPALLAAAGHDPAPLWTGPYLEAPADRLAAWRARLAAVRPGVRRIGIAWQGNPRFGGDRRRSLPLGRFQPLLATAARLGIEVVSLQKGPGRDQIGELPPSLAPRDLGEDFDATGGAFLDCAAVMASLDLVITSDTAIPHLAGALGRPVWTLLGAAPDWRWGAAGESTPWYPSMRLYRQQTEGDWDGVMAAVAKALEQRPPAGPEGAR
jgi:Flp pilus assembly protein TadD